jgi:hypothetical protein
MLAEVWYIEEMWKIGSSEDIARFTGHDFTGC